MLRCCEQAYMLADSLLFLLPFTPSDVLFIGHHIMTTSATSLASTQECLLYVHHLVLLQLSNHMLICKRALHAALHTSGSCKLHDVPAAYMLQSLLLQRGAQVRPVLLTVQVECSTACCTGTMSPYDMLPACEGFC
jgi:hypothetical protein